MLKFLTSIIGSGKYNLRSVLGKVIVTSMICIHTDLSDSKVKDITNMMLYYLSLYMPFHFSPFNFLGRAVSRQSYFIINH